MGALKDVYEIGKDIEARAAQAEAEAERQRFESGKQDFMMEIVNKMRASNATQLGFSAPMPGTLAFAYCETLVGDGFLERNILEGKYFVRSPYKSGSNSLY